jgi:hypothetical protein
MFDLYTGNVRHMPHRTAVPILVSSSVQGSALGGRARSHPERECAALNGSLWLHFDDKAKKRS